MNLHDIISMLILFILGYTITRVITPIVMKFNWLIGLRGVDVHKKSKPILPESGGLAILISSTILLPLIILVRPEYTTYTLVTISVTVFAGLVGYLDDLKRLDAFSKTLLTVIAIAPILVLYVFKPYPYLPFIGRTRLTIIYTILLLFAVAVPSNAFNMLDVYNGVLPSTSILMFSTLFISSILTYHVGIADLFPLYALTLIIGVLLGYYPYNRYPARVFNGDVGSFFLGAYYGVIAVLGRLEVIAITAMLPCIMNSFHILSSIGGLKEKSQIKCRPVIVDYSRELLIANKSRYAPITLANLLLVRGPLRETEIVTCYILLSIVSSILAIIVAVLTYLYT
ncbi:MAG TPA: hypothetical protein EYH40_04535 [Desulfurococcales archaeon]|nr:hypothetical protein [Desulfurococcales archaeon]